MDSTANNLVKIPLAVSHTSGASSLVLAVAGTAFPAPPFRLTAITGPSYGSPTESLTIYAVSAVATNTPSAGECTLTVTTAEGTADQNYGTSDFAEMRLTSGTIADLNAAVSQLTGQQTLSIDTTLIAASPYLNVAATAGIAITLPLASSCVGKQLLIVPLINAGDFVLVFAQGIDSLAQQDTQAPAVLLYGGLPATFAAIADGAWALTTVIAPAVSALYPPQAGGVACFFGDGMYVVGGTGAGQDGQVLTYTVDNTPPIGFAPPPTSTGGQHSVGGSSGSIVWSQLSYLDSSIRTAIYLYAYTEPSIQTITFDYEYNLPPTITFNGTSLSSGSFTFTTVSEDGTRWTGIIVPAATSQTGLLLLEGY